MAKYKVFYTASVEVEVDNHNYPDDEAVKEAIIHEAEVKAGAGFELTEEEKEIFDVTPEEAAAGINKFIMIIDASNNTVVFE